MCEPVVLGLIDKSNTVLDVNCCLLSLLFMSALSQVHVELVSDFPGHCH